MKVDKFVLRGPPIHRWGHVVWRDPTDGFALRKPADTSGVYEGPVYFVHLHHQAPTYVPVLTDS